jgi:AcrR family transcriptional regulator
MTKWEAREIRIENIVNAAVEVFLEKGYEGASMEAIAHRAQMSKGGLYHHFKNKDEILYYANDKLCEPIYQFVESIQNPPDAVAGIKSYIRFYLEHWLSHQKELTFFFLAMTKALTYRNVWTIYEDHFIGIESFLAGLFEKGIRDGQLVEHHPKTSAVTLLSALDGILIYLIMNKNLNPEEVILQFEEEFIQSVLIKTG